MTNRTYFRCLFVVCAILSLACVGGGGGADDGDDPPPTHGGTDVSLSIRNDYPESIFSVDATFSGTGVPDRKVRIIDQQRVASYSRKDFGALLNPHQGETNVALEIATVSAGQSNTFGLRSPLTGHEGDTLLLIFDLDSATLDFAITYKWE